MRFRVLSHWTVAALAASFAFGSGRAQPQDAGYEEGRRAFEAVNQVDQQEILQVFLISAGYLNAMPSTTFNSRLYNSIQRFEGENGLLVDGILSKLTQARLFAIANPMLNLWSFKQITHPTRNVTIWVPLGLGLQATRNEFGIKYTDPQSRILIDFTTVPDLEISKNYQYLTQVMSKQGDTIHYKVFKDNWFVISASSPNGDDHYMRYHQDGRNVTGFSLSWNNANGNVAGERIAILMSASLWSNMTGARFITPPPPGLPQTANREIAAPQTATTTAPPEPSAVSPSPKADDRVSTGTGFFVTANGTFVTNAHVIDGCNTVVAVKSDDGTIQNARIMAKDTVNDLALLRLPIGQTKYAMLRSGIRLGESVAAFGFPHTDMLSTSGNFTLGNVTALTGMNDDVRFLQISAPVQAGNSGGPLMDQYGNLVGVVSAKLNALKVAAANGDLPQNVNFAVKAAILTTFLDANRVTFDVGAAGTKALDPADIAEKAKAISGFVACH